MKRNILSLFILSVFLYSCLKTEVKNPDPVAVKSTEKIALKLSVEDFIKQVENMPAPGARSGSASAESTSGTTQLSDVYFILMDSIGVPIKTIHQAATDPDFGTISDSLVAGNYYASVVASTDSLFINRSYLQTRSNPSDLMSRFFPDFFFETKSFTVSATDSNSVEFALSRGVCQLELDLTDAPAISSDSAVSVIVLNEDDTYALFSSMSISTGGSTPLNMTRKSQYQFSNYLVKTSGISVIINYPDRYSNQILTKRIDNITMKPNTKTILTGKIYTPTPPPQPDGNYNSDFRITINDTWAPDEVTPF